VEAYRRATASLGFTDIVAFPVSARDGDNIISVSPRSPWYKGPSLLTHLETVEPDTGHRPQDSFTLPVQWVNRPNLDFRGYAGTISSGKAEVGMEIIALPGARRAVISRIVTFDGDKESAGTGESITLTLDREIDVSRGDVIAATSHHLSPRRTFTARVLWMIDEPLAPGRDYIIQQGSTSANTRVSALHHMIDVETFGEKPAEQLAMNQIGLITLACDKPMLTANYSDNKDLGAFILIDRLTNQTAGLGTIDLNAAIKIEAPVVTPLAAPAIGLLTRIAGAPGTKARNAFTLRASLEAAAAITLAIVIWLLTANVFASIAVLAFEIIARTMIHAISANGGAGKTSIDEANESGAGI